MLGFVSVIESFIFRSHSILISGNQLSKIVTFLTDFRKHLHEVLRFSLHPLLLLEVQFCHCIQQEQY